MQPVHILIRKNIISKKKKHYQNLLIMQKHLYFCDHRPTLLTPASAIDRNQRKDSNKQIFLNKMENSQNMSILKVAMALKEEILKI